MIEEVLFLLFLVFVVIIRPWYWKAWLRPHRPALSPQDRKLDELAERYARGELTHGQLVIGIENTLRGDTFHQDPEIEHFVGAKRRQAKARPALPGDEKVLRLGRVEARFFDSQDEYDEYDESQLEVWWQ